LRGIRQPTITVPRLLSKGAGRPLRRLFERHTIHQTPKDPEILDEFRVSALVARLPPAAEAWPLRSLLGASEHPIDPAPLL